MKLSFQMAERLGLNHVSQGKGKERFIVVSKPTKIETVSKTNTPRSVQSSNDILDENEPEVSEQSSDDMSTEDNQNCIQVLKIKVQSLCVENVIKKYL